LKAFYEHCTAIYCIAAKHGLVSRRKGKQNYFKVKMLFITEVMHVEMTP
jgi:hypothetical protein